MCVYSDLRKHLAPGTRVQPVTGTVQEVQSPTGRHLQINMHSDELLSTDPEDLTIDHEHPEDDWEEAFVLDEHMATPNQYKTVDSWLRLRLRMPCARAEFLREFC